ncbi:cytidine deaminase-like protein [Pseudovirgaria hyperparasitica]|uniref:Cytidine deaminase-like protein n=1 Tax=Pseudovirgaria hyperparasitica TaxID=470096 RepID=A0A6A6W2B1_9PEZI|nr:cytidine deaminase-like protein [Pseudovirgaria hyperparasitica]KAF2755161.1 cytidine deaminase-like protein [Pseudovirgaria hyperparasitica]
MGEEKILQNALPSDPVSILGSLGSVQVKDGTLRMLKTRAEVKAKSETLDVYALAVPAQYSSRILNTVRAVVPDLNTIDIQHIKRVAKYDFLTIHVLNKFSMASGYSDANGNQFDTLENIRYIVVCPVSSITEGILSNALSSQPPFSDSGFPLVLVTLPVPAYAPTSSEQADEWSVQYWPISYKNTNPYGPHPSMVLHNEAEIVKSSGAALTLAECVANEAYENGSSLPIGCVIVDRTDKVEKVVAIAADARWQSQGSKEGAGNVMVHAVQRAISLVAQKRLRAEQLKQDALHSKHGSLSQEQPSCSKNSSVFLDYPIGDIERRVHSLDNIAAGGYLCTDLDIYITHEPCVMCSMAILHSRFRRIVFQRRMPLTGGMIADSGLKYGIFWRPAELNWKMLAWIWEPIEVEDNSLDIADQFHV